jgi:hypothetical protein
VRQQSEPGRTSQISIVLKWLSHIDAAGWFAGRAVVQKIVRADLLTNFKSSAHTTHPSPDPPALLRTEAMLSLRSHIVAKAAAALPFIRPCDWSRMCVAKQGSSYLGSENLGTSRITRA